MCADSPPPFDTLPGPFTIVFATEKVTEVGFGAHTFSSMESVSAFVEGRKLKDNEFAIINGPVIKQFDEPFLERKL